MHFGKYGRREFITLLGGAAAWPLATHAQQPTLPVIGFLRSTSAAGSTHLVTAMWHGLGEAGLVEGQNVAVEYRWADDRQDRLPALAADLVRRQVAVIVGNGPSALAVKATSATTPVVFVMGSDPVRMGLVASFNRPGGNVTGVIFNIEGLATKQLGLLHELFPKAETIAVLLDPSNLATEAQMRGVEEAGRAIRRKILIVHATSGREFNAAFATIVKAGAGAVLVGGGALFLTQRRQLVTLAARHALPTCYVSREYAEAGGLMSYGSSQTEAYRRAGSYAGRILKGTNPADLPIELTTKYELIINLATAKALEIDIPPTLLALADEVIE